MHNASLLPAIERRLLWLSFALCPGATASFPDDSYSEQRAGITLGFPSHNRNNFVHDWTYTTLFRCTDPRGHSRSQGARVRPGTSTRAAGVRYARSMIAMRMRAPAPLAIDDRAFRVT